MSFFDEGDEPTRVSRPARPRRSSTASRTGGGPPDRQTVLVRQGVALGVGILLLVLIVLGVKGCLDSRKQNALKDYNRNVTAIVSNSDEKVAKPFFQLMSNGAREGQDLQVQVNQLRQAADEDAKKAEGLSVPGAVKDAQRNLTLVLNLRAEALQKVASEIPAAQGRGQQAQNATKNIAADMQNFLTSDVVYSQRVAPLIKQGLDDNGVQGQTISTSKSLPSLAWLSPQTVAGSIGSQGAGGTNANVAPGLHGHGLLSTSAGSVTLQPGVTNRVAAANVVFTVKFANQGDNDESNVKVSVSVKQGPSGKPMTVTKTVPTTKAHTDYSVDIPLGQTPPLGGADTVTTQIGAVPGEKNTTNNKSSYTVIFQG